LELAEIINDDVIDTMLAQLNESGLLLVYRIKGKANEVPMKLLAHSHLLIYFRLKGMTKKRTRGMNFCGSLNGKKRKKRKAIEAHFRLVKYYY
jgi:hypothetical protein